MGAADTAHAEGVRRLYDLMRRVNSPSDLGEVLEEAANAVVEGLGYGVAAISRLEGDTLVMTAVAAPEDVRRQILGRRTPVAETFAEFMQADRWGILRYVPYGRVSTDFYKNMWVPDIVPGDAPDSWHPLDALYAPLDSADGALLGNMAVDLPPGNRVPDQQQRELLEMFVVQAGLAISNAQQRERLAEQVRLGQAVKEVVLTAVSGDLDEVLATAAAAVHRGMPAAQVSLRCFPDPLDNRREQVAGFPGENPASGPLPALRADLVAHVAAHGARPIVMHADGRGCEALPGSRDALAAHIRRHDWSRMVVSPVGAGTEVLGYLGVMRGQDQPEFNEAELDAIHEASRELGRVVLEARVRETQRRLMAELQEVDRYKGELIATISHELRTPLTSIVGHAELLEDSHVHVPSVSAISRNAARLQRLVGSLLDYARIQDKREHVRIPVDLGETCRASLDMLAIQAESAGVALCLVVPEHEVVVAGDPDELARAIDNICGNAVKYTRPGGSVDVVVRAVEGHGEVAVTDTGLGIAPADQARLFSAFHRTTNPEALTIPGTGLGLAIARRIADVHGGTIEVDSALDRGSTFTLRVPMAGRPTAP
ncbi:sensor histidine kinase [Nocardioides panaciterrulae]|uniref:histidine kinase n=1 Tax=Nocardioides panaciterrulae TaxID=661492 RepID=A0A7Y9E6K0_9ACTN|nr:GAF domain-containing sensor histidine kinase [Nocardioides panaciterrulae]NYD42184.1 signal transduction histidine kinase [Nocardioides panaciterrulae]